MLAFIIPVEGGAGGLPTHPIAGGPAPVPPIYIPVDPPANVPGLSPEHPIYLPIYPSHPIERPGGQPPAVWPPPPYPSHPISGVGGGGSAPGEPTQPIYIIPIEEIKVALKNFFSVGYRPPESGMPQPKK